MLPVDKGWIDDVPCARSTYWVRVRARAAELASDGCSGVPDFHIDACYEHDIHWRTGRTIDGHEITTAQANRRFRKVIQARSRWGVLSPMSWWRWAGVTIGARFLSHESI